jgi:hypothetical protein
MSKNTKGYHIKEDLSEKQLLRLIALQNLAILNQLMVDGNIVNTQFRLTYWNMHLEDIEDYTGLPKSKPWTREKALEEIGHSKLSILCNMKKRKDEGMDEKEWKEKMVEFNVWEYRELLEFDWLHNYND